VDNRCYLVFNRPLVPRRTPSTWYLFFEYSHYPHVGPWIPLARSWVIYYFLGPQTSLRLYYYHVLMPCFTVLFTIARGAPVLLWIVARFHGIDKPSHTFRFPVVYSRSRKPLGPFQFRPTSSRVAWWVGPLKYYMNLGISLSWCLVGFSFVFFPRLIVRVLLFVPPAG
jgi:hypothetical protein